MTSFLNWPLLAAITPNLPYSTVGLMVAAQPWSGNYSLGKSLWATAQVTQFSQPGWQFLDGASGYLGGARTNGSYISLRSPDGADYSTIVETTTAIAASTVTFGISGNLSHKQVHVWSTNLDSMSENDHFAHQSDLRPDGSGRYQFTLRPGYIYTFSTLAVGGKGEAIAPPARSLELPYHDNFDRYRAGEEARYASDMQGSFEVQPCAAGRPGMCLQQMAATKPIEWQDNSDAFTLLGDPSWTNYAVSVERGTRQTRSARVNWSRRYAEAPPIAPAGLLLPDIGHRRVDDFQEPTRTGNVRLWVAGRRMRSGPDAGIGSAWSSIRKGSPHPWMDKTSPRSTTTLMRPGRSEWASPVMTQINSTTFPSRQLDEHPRSVTLLFVGSSLA